MSRGVVIFAFNNENIDYVKMAAWNAERVARHLNLPTTLITDAPVSDSRFDQVILTDSGEPGSRWFDDLGQTVPWYNTSRVDAFDLSPYDETIVIDSDYVVCSAELSTLLDSCQNFLCPRYAYDVTNLSKMQDLNWFGAYNMPGAWATVMVFRRTVEVELLFDAIRSARNNWLHYRHLYSISQPNFRNDYALAMSLNLVTGRLGHWPSIPWPLASVDPKHTIEQIDNDEFMVKFVTPAGQFRRITLRDHDFHAMGKKQLGEIIANHS